MPSNHVDVKFTEVDDQVAELSMEVYTVNQALSALQELKETNRAEFGDFIDELHTTASMWWENRIEGAKRLEFLLGVETRPMNVFDGRFSKEELPFTIEEAASTVLVMYYRVVDAGHGVKVHSSVGVDTLDSWLQLCSVMNKTGCLLSEETVRQLPLERVKEMISLSLVQHADLYLLNRLH